MDSATLSGHLSDLLGESGVPATVTLTGIPETGHALAHGANIRFLSARFDTDATGYLSLTIPQLPQAGYEALVWRAVVKPRGYQRQPFTLNFALTADMTWADAARYRPPVVTTDGLYPVAPLTEDTAAGLYLPGALVEDTAAGLYLTP